MPLGTSKLRGGRLDQPPGGTPCSMINPDPEGEAAL
jgi:hypothetical protein